MLKFNNDSYAVLKKLKKILNVPNTSQSLSFIHANYKSVSTTLKKLERRDLLLAKFVKSINEV